LVRSRAGESVTRLVKERMRICSSVGRASNRKYIASSTVDDCVEESGIGTILVAIGLEVQLVTFVG
jgi:hypothetical protein